MSCSRASSSRWTSVNEELEHLLANVPNVVAPPKAFFQTVSARDQIFSEVGKVYAVKWKDVLNSVWHLVDKDENYHNVVYNQNLDQPAIVAGWTVLCDFYQLTGDHLVSLHHYGKECIFSYYIQYQLSA
ncbi:hypothetical protein HKD37_09G025881 [Glycine soja]